MAEFISKRILKECKKSIEDGRNKFRSYFIKLSMYEAFRADVEEILRNEGYEEVIVTE